MSGVFVTGHVRSGTSLTAGLLRAHGVFFGDCGGPTGDNAKGRVENVWLKRAMHTGDAGEWPGSWFRRLRAEGWDRASPWGAKLMPKWWEYMEAADPDVVVLCYRPFEDILASCERVGWDRSEATIKDRWEQMDAILAGHPSAHIVDTPRLASGDFSGIEPVLDALGLHLDVAAAEAWVDPELFHG